MRKSQVRVEDAGLEQQGLTPPMGSEGRGGEEKGSRSFDKEGYLMRAVTFEGRMQPGWRNPTGKKKVPCVTSPSFLSFICWQCPPPSTGRNQKPEGKKAHLCSQTNQLPGARAWYRLELEGQMEAIPAQCPNHTNNTCSVSNLTNSFTSVKSMERTEKSSGIRKPFFIKPIYIHPTRFHTTFWFFLSLVEDGG